MMQFCPKYWTRNLPRPGGKNSRSSRNPGFFRVARGGPKSRKRLTFSFLSYTSSRFCQAVIAGTPGRSCWPVGTSSCPFSTCGSKPFTGLLGQLLASQASSGSAAARHELASHWGCRISRPEQSPAELDGVASKGAGRAVKPVVVGSWAMPEIQTPTSAQWGDAPGGRTWESKPRIAGNPAGWFGAVRARTS